MIVDYGSEFDLLFLELVRQHFITIGGKQYQELLNISYKLDFSEQELEKYVESPHFEDEVEREYLLKRVDDVISVLKNDINSRQAIFANLYDNGLGKCITSAHFFVRDGKVFLNTYFRSQEAEKNLEYDKFTHFLLVNKVSKELGLEVGEITVIVANFHRTIE